ncbi:hypothetical protein HNI00_19100 [Thermoleptolyngbya oregonensis NK1-22]|uniref:Uncharacterized protein n=1 Tax=Thermoleptolyngbya oregonensis NK1-22 TaxID=2547457 RepID=A0AA96YDX4_9CYAN|nr:hypothetical protein [Thermoleptolyngbya sp. M55_K2018_002]WOB45020.1 hypothetical protein HNI00_19100 [Thermoleptolyngbya oregonensis NK1-22]HIK41476.1 hypothetical protein [Thermoleptolyngbya sp. M55_K2018_002]
MAGGIAVNKPAPRVRNLASLTGSAIALSPGSRVQGAIAAKLETGTQTRISSRWDGFLSLRGMAAQKARASTPALW